MPNELAILVVSCDKYKKIWPIFFKSIEKKWPNNIFKKYIVTNHAVCDIDGVNTIMVGNDVTWSSNLRIALNKITENYVLMCIEDMYFKNDIDENRISELMSWIRINKPNYIKIGKSQSGNLEFDNFADIIPGGMLYRTSTVTSVWKKDFLNTFLDPRESAWALEVVGSRRSESYGGFYAVREPIVEVGNLVIKGQVDPVELYQIKKMNLLDDDTGLPTMGMFRVFYYYVCRMRSFLFFLLVPPQARIAVHGFFKKYK